MTDAVPYVNLCDDHPVRIADNFTGLVDGLAELRQASAVGLEAFQQALGSAPGQRLSSVHVSTYGFAQPDPGAHHVPLGFRVVEDA